MLPHIRGGGVGCLSVMGGDSESLYRAIRHQFETASRPRPTRASHVRPELPMHARDPCYRFDLDGWCRRGALCPFRHGPFSRLSELRPEGTRSEQSTSGTSVGVVSVLPCVQGLCGEGFRSHDDGVSLSFLTVGFGESEEASVAKVLRKELQRRARGQPLAVQEVELCVDEYVYDEDALKQALTSASQSSSSSLASAVAESSGQFRGSRIKSED